MTAVQRSHRMTVEEAWRAKLERSAASRPDPTPGEAQSGRPDPAGDPVIGDSGRRAAEDTALSPEPVISEPTSSGTRNASPGAGRPGPEDSGSLGPAPQPMIVVPGPGVDDGAAPRPETVITALSSAGAGSGPSVAPGDAPCAPSAAVRPPLDGVALPAPDDLAPADAAPADAAPADAAPADVDPADADPADAARTVSATATAPRRPSDGAATGTSAMITSSGRPTAPTTAARPRTPITPAPRRPEVRPPARPRIEPEPAILGLSRHTRSRLGSRLFNLFFVFVFALILVQMVVALLTS